MTKKQLWNIKRKLRRRTHEDRVERAFFMYFSRLRLHVSDNIRTPGFTDKGYLKRRVEQPLEYTGRR